MASPSEAQSTASTQMLREAIEIVSHVDKSIYDEIEALLVRIYLATGSGGVSAKRFGGVTSFLVWGATFINIEAYKTRWDAVQFLVHEITHSLLFGLSFDEAWSSIRLTRTTNRRSARTRVPWTAYFTQRSSARGWPISTGHG